MIDPVRDTQPSDFHPERLLTIQEAADALGIHVWALRRAIKRGDVPAFAAFNSRKRVRLSDVLAVIEASRVGGVS